MEQDTVKLLRECDAGVKMGISSMEDVLGHIDSDGLKRLLSDSRADHIRLEREIRSCLDRYHDGGKAPGIMAKGMSQIKTNVKLALGECDAAVAELMTDGCGMGVKSLNRYLNQYKAADEQAKELAKRLIRLEEQLAVELRRFL